MNAKRSAFTLVEILIVVVIMAVLAATIIPQFQDSTEDAQVSTAVFNLQTLRSQIELYKAQHSGNAPDDLAKLAQRTNASGATGTLASTHPFGPYMMKLPENPFNNKTDSTAISSYPPTSADGSTGWLYHAASGNIYINHATHYTE